jgi:hypothetical protein
MGAVVNNKEITSSEDFVCKVKDVRRSQRQRTMEYQAKNNPA